MTICCLMLYICMFLWKTSSIQANSCSAPFSGCFTIGRATDWSGGVPGSTWRHYSSNLGRNRGSEEEWSKVSTNKFGFTEFLSQWTSNTNITWWWISSLPSILLCVWFFSDLFFIYHHFFPIIWMHLYSIWSARFKGIHQIAKNNLEANSLGDTSCHRDVQSGQAQCRDCYADFGGPWKNCGADVTKGGWWKTKTFHSDPNQARIERCRNGFTSTQRTEDTIRILDNIKYHWFHQILVCRIDDIWLMDHTCFVHMFWPHTPYMFDKKLRNWLKVKRMPYEQSLGGFVKIRPNLVKILS